MSIDFYENDITNMGDNCIETDGGGRNMRVFRNRCANTALQGLSAQPIFGGPVYFIRNIVYNGPGSGSLKFVSTPTRRALLPEHVHRRGRGAGACRERALPKQLDPRAGRRGGRAQRRHVHQLLVVRLQRLRGRTRAPRRRSGGLAAVRARAPTTSAPPVARSFRTLADYQKATGQDLHSRLVDYDVFVNVPKPDCAGPAADLRRRGRSTSGCAALGGDRCGHGAAERDGRVHGHAPGSRRARVRAAGAALRAGERRSEVTGDTT